MSVTINVQALGEFCKENNITEVTEKRSKSGKRYLFGNNQKIGRMAEDTDTTKQMLVTTQKGDDGDQWFWVINGEELETVGTIDLSKQK